MKRRAFLRQMGLRAVLTATVPLLQACRPGSPPSSGSAAKPGGAAVARLQMPTYVPFQGPKPDVAGTADGVDPGYYTYPQKLVKSVSEVPGHGEEITAMTNAILAAPVPMEQNAAWQEANRRMGVTFKIILAASGDYQQKLNTIIASGDLPDLMYNVHSNVGNAPEFMRTGCADLTPYLSGDAVKDYPNLANIPPPCWKQTVFNGAIYAIPVPRAPFGQTWKIRQDLVEQAGLSHPKNAAELKQFLTALTKPQANQFAVANTAVTVTGGAFGLATTYSLPQIFRAPNNWKLDGSGKLTKDFETDEYKAAVAYTRDLYVAGVYHPNSTTYNATALENDWKAGKVVSNSTSWGAYTQQWGQLAAVNPAARARNLQPFGHDGGQAMYHYGPSNFGLTFAKKGSPDRVRLLLRTMNFLSAPFGSEESNLLLYGVEGTDYTVDQDGTPQLTERGRVEVTIPWKYLTANPSVLFDPNRSREFVDSSQADEKAMVAVGVNDPTLGYFSATNTAKAGLLNQAFYNGLQEIVTGQRQLGELDRLIKEWRDGGGDKMRAEFEQALQEAKT